MTPPNGTEVTREIGAVNVTFECVVTNDQGMQDTTQWNIENFRGNPGAQSILMALNDTILGGEPSNGVLPTFRTRLIFPEFLEDLDGTTLTCGLPPASSLRDGQFQLRVYSKSLCNISHSLHAKEGITYLPPPSSLFINPPPPPPPPPFLASKPSYLAAPSPPVECCQAPCNAVLRRSVGQLLSCC